MTRALVREDHLYAARDAIDARLRIAGSLQDQGITCEMIGVHGRKLDTDYRLEIAPPWRVDHDPVNRRWLVWQGPQPPTPNAALPQIQEK